jgi:hypothetical protein
MSNAIRYADLWALLRKLGFDCDTLDEQNHRVCALRKHLRPKGLCQKLSPISPFSSPPISRSAEEPLAMDCERHLLFVGGSWYTGACWNSFLQGACHARDQSTLGAA